MSLPPYTPAAPSKEPCKLDECYWEPGCASRLTCDYARSVDYVQLVNLDLSKYETPEGRKGLAAQLYEAATGYGFLTLTNHGISDEVYQRQMQISNAVMTLPPEEKKPFAVTPQEDARGLYVGFKPSGPLGHKGGFPKQLDHYNILVHDPKQRPHPEIIRPYLEETHEVMHFIRNNILKKLLALMAMVLEVPESDIQATHALGGSKTEYIRYMVCEPRPREESEKYRDIFLSGHTDWGSWTFLFSQPIAALQVLDHHDGKYRWVRHQPNGLVINFGEALERLTGGLFKATIHRVVQPPVDQRHLRRIGVIYFARPADDCELKPLESSPLLRRLGRDKPIDDRIFCMADYLDARKHGWKRYEYDIDRPADPVKHADFFAGEYTDPAGHKSLGKFDDKPREVYVPTLKA
ncbi:Isopenicillin N synthase [Geosmithia morbida]|uniref:Isopenicillin N synthase n=1 Tax=Geosmithia morbida TaxID=1094350 RepID=A0A9P4YUL9_9HYPO|nr:Isopenicillin N synthase [Geosmithia morbida]KAF4123090.1 Isopenicillin N synthase [Geosmithia morbida]